jgi:hypothetical protein
MPRVARVCGDRNEELSMGYRHLKGRIFKRDGMNYLVLDDNDWSAERLRVKTVDASQRVVELPARDILRSVYPLPRSA